MTEAAGITAVDIDGSLGRETLMRVAGPDAPTSTCVSKSGRASGGGHMLFKTPEGVIIQNSSGDGLDIKSHGGFIVLPPSAHKSGDCYGWLFGELGITELPELPEVYRDFAINRTGHKAAIQPAILTEFALPSEKDAPGFAILAELSVGDFDVAAGSDPRLEATEADIRLAISAVNVLRPEAKRDLWRDLVFASYDTIDDEGARARIKIACREWSRKAGNYTDEGFDNVWGSAETSQRTNDQKAKWGTLRHYALEAGWDEAAARERIAKEMAAENLVEAKTVLEAGEAAGTIPAGTSAKLDAALGFVALPELGSEEIVEIKGRMFRWRDPRNDPPRPFLGKDKHHCRGYLGSTIGRTGDGKTSAELVEMVGFATGLDLLNGGAPHRCGPITIWYWNLEDPLVEIEKRVQAIVLHYKLDPKTLGDRLIINSGRDRNLIVAKKKNGEVMLTPNVDALKREMKRLNVSILALDPFIKTHLLDENKSELDFAVNAFAGIASDCNAAVDLCHHIRKGLRGEASIASDDDARGSSTLISAVRAARMVVKMTADEAKKFSLGPDEHGNFFRIDRATANMVPFATKRSRWFQFHSVAFDNATEEYPGDNVAAVAPWTPPDPLEGLPLGVEALIQTKLGDKVWRRDAQAKDWVGYPIAEALFLDPTKAKARIKVLIDIWVRDEVLVEFEEDNPKKKGAKILCVRAP